MSSRKTAISASVPAPAVYLSLLVCAGLFIAFGWQTISLLADVYKGSEDYSHGFVVPLVSLYAAYEIRKKYPQEMYTSNWMGLPIALLGSLIVILGIWYRYALLPGGLGVQSITGTGLFILLIGLSCSLGGTQIIKRYFFPLGYMAFTIPWPESLTNKLTVPLRSIVTDVSVDIIRQCGFAVFQEGNIIHLATATLGVADACSGIRSLWIMLATAVAFGYFLRCGLVRSLALFILAIPLSMLFNVVRVVATGILVALYGPQWSIGTKHEMTGAVVFLLGVVTLVAIGWVLAIGRHSATAAGSAESPAVPIKVGASSHGRTARSMLVTLLALLLILGTIAQTTIKRHYVQNMPVATRKPFTVFPKNIGEFHESGKGGFEATQIDLLRPTDMLSRTYRSPQGNDVAVWSLYWEPYRGKKSAWNLGPHRPEGCYPATGWNIIPHGGPEVLTDLVPGRTFKSLLFKKQSDLLVVLYMTSDVENVGGLSKYPSTALNRLRQLLDSWNSPDVVWGAQYVVTVQVAVKSTVQDALEDAMLLIKQMAPILPGFGV